MERLAREDIDIKGINIQEKLELFTDLWSPKVVSELNDYQIKLVKLQGEFVWHSHEDTDELFLCLHGELTIELRDGAVHLDEGQLFVVPRGVEHRPVATEECHVMLIEPKGVINTGDAETDRAAAENQWI